MLGEDGKVVLDDDFDRKAAAMKVPQPLVNQLCVGLTKMSEMIVGDIDAVIREKEEKALADGDTEAFNKIQQLKIHRNELEAISNRQRTQYPHLFK